MILQNYMPMHHMLSIREFAYAFVNMEPEFAQEVVDRMIQAGVEISR